jgi:hypothetical protein
MSSVRLLGQRETVLAERRHGGDDVVVISADLLVTATQDDRGPAEVGAPEDAPR